jgi:hypothetical protein
MMGDVAEMGVVRSAWGAGRLTPSSAVGAGRHAGQGLGRPVPPFELMPPAGETGGLPGERMANTGPAVFSRSACSTF